MFIVTEYAALNVLTHYAYGIIELLGHCIGGNFNIHIWAWFGYFICLKREIRFYLEFSKEF